MSHSEAFCRSSKEFYRVLRKFYGTPAVPPQQTAALSTMHRLNTDDLNVDSGSDFARFCVLKQIVAVLGQILPYLLQ